MEFVNRSDWTPLELHKFVRANGMGFGSMERLLTECFRIAPADGLLAEFGVHEGGTLKFIASYMQPRVVYGFDSFRGLPHAWNSENPAGKFDLGGVPPSDLPENARTVVGWFSETLPGFVADNPQLVSFLHIDSDLYSSAKTVLDHLGPHFQPGTVLNFHEWWHHPGEHEGEAKALAEWLNASGRSVAPVGFCGEYYSQAAFVIGE